MRAYVAPVVLATMVMLAGCERTPDAQAGDPALGKAVAEANCQKCHAIGPDGPSPLADAPPFREIVKQWPPENLAEALAEGIVVTHEGVDQMPTFQFEPEEIDNLIAYLNTLQPQPQ